jgi:hypothetical protein
VTVQENKRKIEGKWMNEINKWYLIFYHMSQKTLKI